MSLWLCTYIKISRKLAHYKNYFRLNLHLSDFPPYQAILYELPAIIRTVRRNIISSYPLEIIYFIFTILKIVPYRFNNVPKISIFVWWEYIRPIKILPTLMLNRITEMTYKFNYTFWKCRDTCPVFYTLKFYLAFFLWNWERSDPGLSHYFPSLLRKNTENQNHNGQIGFPLLLKVSVPIFFKNLCICRILQVHEGWIIK